ncbi:MAG: hypothetical protein E7208_02090 [Clostridium butyricum]|nr:hypothetical protein [Clostridium butyricum]
MSYEDLLIECSKDGAIVKEKPLKANDGLCSGNRIAIKNTLTNKEKLCTLSEEYGHYKKTYGNILDQSKVQNRKQELIARRWGYNKICGLEQIADAIISGAKDRYEIAEKLNVTDEFFDRAIQYMRLKYGVKRKCKDITFYFEPTFAISKPIY